MEQLAKIRGWTEHPPARLGWDGDLQTLRRSAVAIIIRIKGHSAATLDEYLSTAPRDAQVELLFIKRAISVRDRWSGHIALPGGRQNPGESDWETAIRETAEEVGIDLVTDAWRLGPLDQRLLRISWGRKVAMCLCPFAFVLNKWDAQPTLQLDEVATAFWIPLAELLNTRNATTVEVPVGDRLNLPWYVPNVVESLIKSQVGDLVFPAITLSPETLLGVTRQVPSPPYKLWGVTLGILQDLFQVVDSGHVHRITQPTLAHWDMRLLVHLWSRNDRRRKQRQVLGMLGEVLELGPGKMDISNRMLEGHFRGFPLIVFTALALRLASASAVAAYLFYIIRKYYLRSISKLTRR